MVWLLALPVVGNFVTNAGGSVFTQSTYRWMKEAAQVTADLVAIRYWDAKAPIAIAPRWWQACCTGCGA
jgi:hypothetical protein